MPSADPAPPPPTGPPANAAPGARQRLLRRLVWLTVAAVLIADGLFLLPSIARARQEWLERHLREGQLAALALGDGPVAPGRRDDLLRLAGVDAVTLREPGGAITLARPGTPPLSGAGVTAAEIRLDLNAESLGAAVADALGGLFRAGDAALRVEGPSSLGDGGRVMVLVHRRTLDRALARHARHVGLISFLVAAVAGLLLYGALQVLLVRPMRRLTANISAFRADPERAGSFDHDEQGDDEIAVAGRELALMQQELRAALWRNARLAALGTTVAKVSHDLRGILSPALLTAERLQLHQDPSIRRAGDTLVRAVERATELVRRTVDYAREIPVAPQRQRLLLHQAIEEAAEQTRVVCPGLAVENAVAASVEIDAERGSIVRVFANLLRNAGEAQARHVRVAADEEPGGIAVTVTDDGPGLPQVVQQALFRPFVTGTRPGSTGLGLAIVRDLMQAHGGDVTLLGTGAGGTSFRLELRRPSRAPAVRAPAELRG